MKVQGACHCGHIAFQAEVDPAKVGLCHCTACQTLSSSAFSMFVPVAKEAFSLVHGQPKIYVKTGESGARRAQAFCPECGTRIYACAELDAQRLWCRSALPWVMDLGSVEKIPKQPAM